MPDGDSQIFRSYVFGPSGLNFKGLCYTAKFDPFLSLDCTPRPPPWRNPRNQILPSGNLEKDNEKGRSQRPPSLRHKLGISLPGRLPVSTFVVVGAESERLNVKLFPFGHVDTFSIEDSVQVGFRAKKLP